MMTFLTWALGGFWRFVGVLVLLGTALDGIANIVRSFRPRTAKGTAKNSEGATNDA